MQDWTDLLNNKNSRSCIALDSKFQIEVIIITIIRFNCPSMHDRVFQPDPISSVIPFE